MTLIWIRRSAALAGLLSLALVTFAVAQQADDKPADNKPADRPSASANGKARNPGAAFDGVLAALKNSPGCYGIETAQTSSGKQVVFAWFKDREAVIDWYYSDAHQQLMGMLGDDAVTTDPLQGVAEGEGPLMCVAAVTWKKPSDSSKPAAEGGDYQPQIPISQISVEVFKPVTAAKAFNGAFSPAEALLPAPEPAGAASN